MMPTGAASIVAKSAEKPPIGIFVRRFAQDLSRLWGEGGRLGLAVSGGTDSLAMLLLADTALHGQFEVATVDHGLRPESSTECAMVKEICAARRIPCEMLKVNVGNGNVQAWARKARYQALAGWARERSLDAIATAHHADDQAETFLMRLAYGSGVKGLAGVRGRGTVPFGDDLPLLRPMLGFMRSDCEVIVERAGLKPVHDPSNVDDHYLRARIRKALKNAPIASPQAIVMSAANLADADEALDWAAKREWNEQVTVMEGQIRYHRVNSDLPKAIILRVLLRAVALIGSEPRGQGVAGLLARLEAGKDANLAGVIVRVSDGDWLFMKEPPRRSG